MLRHFRILYRENILGIFVFLIFQGSISTVPASAFDFSSWDTLLKKYVAPKTISGIRVNAVAYQKIKTDPDFDQLIDKLSTYPVNQIKSSREKLAFWINTYNIMALKMVLDHYPVDSIKDAGSLFSPVWEKTVGVVGNKQRTLNEIEHEILRKMDEPRIHLAIVCASVSCPDLRREAYTPESLDQQLDDQMKQFLINRGKGLNIEGGRVYISSIFKWFKEDFESRGGALIFITPYVSLKDQTTLKGGKLKISYLDYDWNLNKL